MEAGPCRAVTNNIQGITNSNKKRGQFVKDTATFTFHLLFGKPEEHTSFPILSSSFPLLNHDFPWRSSSSNYLQLGVRSMENNVLPKAEQLSASHIFFLESFLQISPTSQSPINLLLYWQLRHCVLLDALDCFCKSWMLFWFSKLRLNSSMARGEGL